MLTTFSGTVGGQVRQVLLYNEINILFKNLLDFWIKMNLLTFHESETCAEQVIIIYDIE